MFCDIIINGDETTFPDDQVLAPELRFACTGLFTLYAYGVLIVDGLLPACHAEGSEGIDAFFDVVRSVFDASSR
jgi:hypothetical protein